MRKRRKYSLFSVKVVNGRKRYERLSNLALPKDSAVRFLNGEQGQLCQGELPINKAQRIKPCSCSPLNAIFGGEKP
jgi:hypothetical protein